MEGASETINVTLWVAVAAPCWEAAEDHSVPGDDVARLLASVPECFGQSKSNAEYIYAARTKETWTVRVVDGSVIGVVSFGAGCCKAGSLQHPLIGGRG